MENNKRTSKSTNGSSSDHTLAGVNLSEKSREVANDMEEKFEELSKSAGELASNFSKKSKQYGRDARAYIEERPVTSLAVAFGVGFLASFFIASRRR